MEGPKELCERIDNDVDKILKMYDLAAKSYPYENVHGPRSENEQQQRTNNSKFLTDQNPDFVLSKGHPYSLLFVYLMSRPGSKGLFDLSKIFERPSRAVGWFLLGNSILMFWKVSYSRTVRESGASQHSLHQRVAQNEHTHAILKSMKFHLQTRKMGVFEANPR